MANLEADMNAAKGLVVVMLLAVMGCARLSHDATPIPTREELEEASGLIGFDQAQQFVVTYMVIQDARAGGSSVSSRCGLPLPRRAGAYTAELAGYLVETVGGCLFAVDGYSGQIVAPINYRDGSSGG